MKILENKNFQMEMSKDEKATTFSLAKFCINQPPQGGFSLDEIENRLRISGALEESNVKAKIDAADIKTLKAAVMGMKWPIVHKDLITFRNQIEALK